MTLGAMVIILGPRVRAFPMEITHILYEKAHLSRSNVQVCHGSAPRADVDLTTIKVMSTVFFDLGRML